MVNSPMTIANVMKAPESTPDMTFGKMQRNMIVGHLAPRISAASVSVRTSIVRIAVSTERYM